MTAASNVTWQPFGPLSGLTYRNGLSLAVGYDQDYQPQSRVVAGVQNLSYGFDAAGRMTAANDNLDTTRSQSFGYDALSRLTSASGLYGSVAYGYDNGGNRTSAGAASYAYASTSNQLQSVTANGNTRSFTYDGRGNLTGDARSASANWTLTYTQEGRLSQVADNGQIQAIYSYDYLGRRSTKTIPGTPVTVSVYSYDRKGHLLAEADGQGDVIAEYVWLEDLPVALISGGTVYAIHTDHLGTPQKITDPNQTLVWDAITTPWGEMASLTSVLTANLRLPGQYYDAECGYHQNWHRDYAPSLGRYLQPDPIGLAGGWNDYAYVGGNPVGRVDPNGEFFVLALPWLPEIAIVVEEAVAGLGILAASQPDDLSPQQRAERKSDRDNYHQICDEPPPPGLCGDDLKRWKLDKAQRCMEARQDFADKWHGGTMDPGHQRQMDQLQASIDRLLRYFGRNDH